MIRPYVPSLLSFNGGYVDTAGFLALHGLFTAHVTGNFVTLGAALALGTSGIVAKLLALPIFCIVVMLARILGRELPRFSVDRLRTLLLIKVVLLAIGGGLALAWGPFADGDAWQAIVTGLVLVSAMAIQNAVNRVHLAKLPPTTIMTGTSTQIMIDIADLLTGHLSADDRIVTLARARRLGMAVGVFAIGCLAAAGAYIVIGMGAFLLPPLVALVTALSVKTEDETGTA